MASTKPAAKITIRFNEHTDAGVLLPKGMYEKDCLEENHPCVRYFIIGCQELGAELISREV